MSFREATDQEAQDLWVVGTVSESLVQLFPAGAFNLRAPRKAPVRPDQDVAKMKGSKGHIFYDGSQFKRAEMASDGTVLIDEE